MMILKWYSIILMTFLLAVWLYKSGKDEEEIYIILITLILYLPMFLYVILS